MKQSKIRILLVIFAFLVSFTLVSCKRDPEDFPEPIKYVVSFESNGGSVVDDYVVQYGTKVIKPEDPIKAGFNFDSWYKDKDLTIKWDFDNDLVLSSLILYAKWDENNTSDIKYTVKFESNKGTQVLDVLVLENTKLGRPVNPQKANHIFIGWYKDVELKTKFNFEKDLIKSNMTLYAKWDKDESLRQHTISFETNGGSFIDILIVEDGDLIPGFNDPKLKDHILVGWYKNIDLTLSWDFNNDKVTEDLTLYAKWELIKTEYIVKFDSLGGSKVNSLNIKANNLIEKPEEPTKTNFIFSGWYKERELLNIWNFEKDLVTSDLVLYAKWEIDSNSDWDLIDNSNLKDVLRKSDLSIFKNDKYYIEANVADTFDYYNTFMAYGIIDLNKNFSKRKSSSYFEGAYDDFIVELYQKEGIFYSHMREKGGYTDYGIEKIDTVGFDYINLLFGIGYEEINQMFSSFILSMLDSENIIDNTNVKLYKNNSSYKIDINLDELDSDDLILNMIMLFSGNNNISDSYGEISFSIILDNDEVTSVDLDIDISTSNSDFILNFKIDQTSKEATFPEDLDDGNDEVLTFFSNTLHFSDGTKKAVVFLEDNIYEEDLNLSAFEDGYQIIGYYHDENYQKEIILPSKLMIKNIYVKREKTLTFNEYIDELLSLENYTIDFYMDNFELLITEKYQTYNNVLYNKESNKILINEDGKVIELSSNLSDPFIKFNIQDYIKNQPIYLPQNKMIFIGNDNTYLIFNNKTKVFEYHYKDSNPNSSYIETINFKIENIDETEIDEEFLKSFKVEEYESDLPIEIEIYSDEIYFHDLDESNLPYVRGKLKYNNHYIYFDKLSELKNYQINIERIAINDYIESLSYLENVFVYLFYFNEKLLGETIIVEYNSSRGSILVNPKYFNDGYSIEDGEPLYYYIDEINELPNFNYKEDIYEYRYEFRNLPINSIEDLRKFNNKVIKLNQIKIFQNIDLFYDQIINGKLEVYIRNSKHIFDFVNEEILLNNSVSIIHINNKPYFKLNNNSRFSNLYMELTESNLIEYYDSRMLNTFMELYNSYLVLKNKSNYSYNDNYISINGFARFKNDLTHMMVSDTGRYKLNFDDSSKHEKLNIYKVSIDKLGIFYSYSDDNHQMSEVLREIVYYLNKYDFYIDEDFKIKLTDENFNDYNDYKELKIYSKYRLSYEIDPEEYLEILENHESYTLTSQNIIYKVNKNYIEFIRDDYYHDNEMYVLDRKTNNLYHKKDGILLLDDSKFVIDFNYLNNNYDDRDLSYGYYGPFWQYTYRTDRLYINIGFLSKDKLSIDFLDYQDENNTRYDERFVISDINNTTLEEYDFNDAVEDEIIEININYKSVYLYEEFLHNYYLTIKYKYNKEKILSSNIIKHNYNYNIIKNGDYIDYSIEIDGRIYEIINHKIEYSAPVSISFPDDLDYYDLNKKLENNKIYGIISDGNDWNQFNSLQYLIDIGIDIREEQLSFNEDIYLFQFYFDNELIGENYFIFYNSRKDNIVINPNFDMDNKELKPYYYINELEDLTDLMEDDGKFITRLYHYSKEIKTIRDLKLINEEIIELTIKYSYINEKIFYNNLIKHEIIFSNSNYDYNFSIDLENQEIRSNSFNTLKYIDGDYYYLVEDDWEYQRYILFDENLFGNSHIIYDIYKLIIELYEIFSDINNFSIENNKLKIEKLGTFDNIFNYKEINDISNDDYNINFYNKTKLDKKEEYTINIKDFPVIKYLSNTNNERFNSMFDIFLNKHSEKRFYIDEEDYSNNWINTLKEEKSIVLNFDYTDDYLTDYAEYLNIISKYDSYTLDSYNYYKVTKDVVEFNLDNSLYVLDRVNRKVYLNENDKLYLVDNLIFDLEYVTNNYLSLEKLFVSGKWEFHYMFSDHKYIISFDTINKTFIKMISRNPLHGNNYELEFDFQDINNTMTDEYDFTKSDVDIISGFDIIYKNYLDINTIKDSFQLVLYFESGKQYYYSNVNAKEQLIYEFILNENNTYFDFKLNVGGIEIRKDKLSCRDEDQKVLIFNTSYGEKVLTYEEFLDINTIEELNAIVLNNLIETADFNYWYENYFGRIDDLELFKEIIEIDSTYWQDNILYFHYSTVDYRFRSVLNNLSEGVMEINYGIYNLQKNYQEIIFTDHEGKYYLIEYYDEIIYSIDYERVDLGLLDKDILKLVVFLKDLKNNKEPLDYKDNVLYYEDGITITRTRDIFILKINDIETELNV